MERSRSMEQAIDIDGEASTSRANTLSEENLRIHDAACPREDGYFQVNLIREERARAAEHETYRQLFGEVDRLSDAEFSPQVTDMAARREASLDALRLYTGSFASLSTPMDRFVAMSPTQDAHPWLARNVMNDTGIASGDLEALDVRRLASELVSAEIEQGEIKAQSPGSPRPSSDTLSVTKYLEARRERKEHGGARHRRRLKMRRRSTMDKTKLTRSPHKHRESDLGTTSQQTLVAESQSPPFENR